MSSTGQHNKYKTCQDCPHRERIIENFNGKVTIYDCHDHCEGYLYRKAKIDEQRNLIREAKKAEGIELV